jgi:beta-alanine degradation protein BauB
MTRFRIALLTAGWLVLTSGSNRAQDRADVIPDMKVLLQNDRVRVQFHDVKVGETTAVHSHPAYVAYVFNPYAAKAVLPGGTEIEVTRKAGDVFYSGPVTHGIVNTGRTHIHNLIMELK